MNEQGKLCPKCGQDIGIWTIIKALWPTMLSCPHCKAAIRYDNSGWGLITVGIIFCLPILSILAANIDFFAMSFVALLFTASIISLLIWLPMELFMVFYLRRNQKLILKTK